MTPDRWRRIEEIYHEASALEEATARATFLASSCGGDASLRQEVEGLLKEDSRAESFLEVSALEEAARSLAEDRGPSFMNRQIGGYQILSFLGAGGMGEVYRARDLKLERDVALKVFARSTAGGADFLRRVEEEARIASGLNHPNIVTIHGVGEDTDVLYIAMELVEGRTLREHMADTSIDVAEAFAIAMPVADALAAAHAAGIAHLDLKPENIMVRSDGLVKILDFGLAKRANVLPESAAGTGTIRGTRGYMSPEQATGRAAGPASDQFSFGVLLAELLRAPDGSGRSEVPVSLQSIVDCCCALDPNERYPSTGELALALRRARDGWNRPVAVLSRRQAIWLGGGAVVAVGAGGTIWRLWSPPYSPQGIASLAVLPFVHASTEEDIEYLADGVTESLIRGISRLPSLKVSPRSTVFNFKGKTIGAQEAGRLLNVDAVLSGTVVRASERISVATELVDVRTGAQLWRHTYDRPAVHLLALEDDIANAIVNDGIRLHLSGEERGALARHPTNDPEVYELYLRAVHQHRKQTERGYLTARELLQKAVVKDPRFALAYAELAATYTVMAIDGFERPADVRAEVRRNVEQANVLDPDLPAARGEAAAEAFFFDWNWRVAEREWQAALQTRTGDIEPDSLLGYVLERWAVGRSEEALQLARRAREIDFLSPAFAVREADFLFQTHQFGAAAMLYQKVIHDEPDEPRAYFGLAEVFAAQERFDEAIEARRLGYAAVGDDALASILAVARGEAGYRQIVNASARLEIDALRSRSATGAYVSPLDFARAHAQLGEKERAFSYLDAAFVDRAPGLVFLKADASWAQLRDDVRFAAAVRRVGLP